MQEQLEACSGVFQVEIFRKSWITKENIITIRYFLEKVQILRSNSGWLDFRLQMVRKRVYEEDPDDLKYGRECMTEE